MSGFLDGLRALEEALAGLDDPHSERLSRIEARLRDVEERLEQVGRLFIALSEQPDAAPPTKAVAPAD